jgi:hypothetical protein
LTGQVTKITQEVGFTAAAFEKITSVGDFLSDYKASIASTAGVGSDKVKVTIHKVKVMVEVAFSGTIADTPENKDKLAQVFADRAGAGVSKADVTIEFLTRRLLQEVERALAGTTRVKATIDVKATGGEDHIVKAKGIKTLVSDTAELTKAVKAKGGDFANITASSVSVSYKVTVKIEVQTTGTISAEDIASGIATQMNATVTTTEFSSPSDTTTTPATEQKKSTNGSPQSSGYIFTAFMLVLAVITKTLV